MILLSIIIPTYNMEKYIARCLNYVILGNESRHDFEILVINDGSKDYSLKIAEQFKDKYPNIIRVIDKENGNYGSCVNRGLKEATGKYFRILDADDTFQVGALEIMLDSLSSSDEDMIVSRYSYLYDLTGRKKQIVPNGIQYDKLYHRYDFSGDGNDVILSMHAVTYKTALLRDIGLKLDEGVSYTDLEYIYFPLKAIKSLKFLDIDLYEYHIGREGQTVDPKSQAKSINSFLTVTKRLVDDYALSYKNASTILQNNERITINKIIYATFKIALVLCPKNEDSDRILKDIYSKVKRIDDNVLCLKKKKIRPIVLLWHFTGLYFSSIKKIFRK